MTEKIAKLLVRIPADIKPWLEREAERNFSSQASEIVRALRSRFEAETEQRERAQKAA